MNKKYRIDPKPGDRMVVLGDIHEPCSHTPSMTMVAEILKFVQPKWLIQIGDFGEFASVSKHGRLVGQETDLALEITAVADSARRLAEITPNTRRICTLGNHEFRIERYRGDNPVIANVRELDIAHRLREVGWKSVPYNIELEVGDHLRMQHTLENTLSKNNVSAVGKSFVQGHTHAAAAIYAGQTFGSLHVGWQIGWLGDYWKLMANGFIAKAKTDRHWIHGCMLLDFSVNGLFSSQFIPFIEDDGAMRACVDGKWCEIRCEGS